MTSLRPGKRLVSKKPQSNPVDLFQAEEKSSLTWITWNTHWTKMLKLLSRDI